MPHCGIDIKQNSQFHKVVFLVFGFHWIELDSVWVISFNLQAHAIYAFSSHRNGLITGNSTFTLWRWYFCCHYFVILRIHQRDFSVDGIECECCNDNVTKEFSSSTKLGILKSESVNWKEKRCQIQNEHKTYIEKKTHETVYYWCTSLTRNYTAGKMRI